MKFKYIYSLIKVLWFVLENKPNIKNYIGVKMKKIIITVLLFPLVFISCSKNKEVESPCYGQAFSKEVVVKASRKTYGTKSKKEIVEKKLDELCLLDYWGESHVTVTIKDKEHDMWCYNVAQNAGYTNAELQFLPATTVSDFYGEYYKIIRGWADSMGYKVDKDKNTDIPYKDLPEAVYSHLEQTKSLIGCIYFPEENCVWITTYYPFLMSATFDTYSEMRIRRVPFLKK